MKLKKLVSGLTSLALAFSAFAGLSFSKPENAMDAQAATTVWNFDFGGGGTASGYTGVSATEGYSASKGYGFAQTNNVSNVSASGSGALSDAVQFKSTAQSNTFNVDLPKGLYQISVNLGNTARTSVRIENMLQIINMTGNNAYHTLQVPITDGQLNIMATEGKAGYAFTMSSLKIEKISDDPTTKPTIWLCGDSTVCNYYPLTTSEQGGWGQMLDQFVDTSVYEIRNQAASGQYAKGFVDAGQFEPIEYYGKPGDIYIISIGINDTNYSNGDEYYTTVTDMVKRAKAKGMEVILVKQQGRKGDYTRNPLLTGRWFGTQLDQIGKEQSVQVIDLFNLWQDYCVSIGATAADALYIDNLHPNRAGAIKLAELAMSQIDLDAAEPLEGAVMDENAKYMFKNVNSGLYMEAEGGKAEAGTNVQQWGANGTAAHNTWQVKAASDGYYYIYSLLGDGKTYYLDVDYGNAENGTNIGIYTSTNSDAQLFKFVKNSDGSYTIVTKVSKDKSAVEVGSASKESGANIQEWELNGHNCQKWIAETVVYPPVTTDAPETTTSSNTTTTTEKVPDKVVVKGDANCNGTVEVADAVYILQCIADPDSFSLTDDGKFNADVVGNNGVDAEDALYIQMAKVGLVVIEPYTPPVPEVVYYYAVDAQFSEGVREDTNAGFTGEAYVNLDNNSTSNITWTVNAEKAGNYLCTFNIANGTDTDRPMKVEVNGVSDPFWLQPFLGTGAWTTWAERAIVLPLNAGSNTIKLTSWTANGGPNFDYLRIELTDEPIAEVYIPEQQPDIPVVENPVIYIAGDSTVQSYRASYAPQQGWGYYLGNYFNSNVSVSNHAIAGRSSKSFYDNGRLTTILDSMKAGDYLLIQFAINDSASSNAERYAPVCGNASNPTEGSYEWYLTKYIEGTLEKGGTPVLVTTVIGMKAYSGGKFVNSYGNYCQAMKDLAAKYKIPCIDLNSLMVSHYNSVGYDTAKSYHLMGAVEGSTDGTHFCEKGADIVAGIVANAIKGAGIDLSNYVK